MTRQPFSLAAFADRVAIVVTDLNGFRSALVNDEISEADFGNDLTQLFTQLRQVEKAVEKLGNEFWKR